MNKKRKEKKIRDSFDALSKEMAEFTVNNKKDRIESEIEKDVIKVDKNKRRKDRELSKNKLNTVDEFKIRRANSKEDLKSFKPKNQNKNGREIMEIEDSDSSSYNKGDKLSEKKNLKNKSTQNLEKVIKNDIEITISPYYENKEEEEEDEVNYYNIRYYIDNKNRLEKKKLTNHKNTKNKQSKSLFSKNDNIKRAKPLSKKKILNKKMKREYNFLFEDQQNDDSSDWDKYLDDSIKNNKDDKILLFTNSNNNSLNQNNQDSKDHLDLSDNNSKEKNIAKDNNMIFDYFQHNFKHKKNFFERQLYRKKMSELKINRKREMIKFLENKKEMESSHINKKSLDTIRKKGDYVPLFKRALGLEHLKRTKILIMERLKYKSLSVKNSKLKKRTHKQNNTFSNKPIKKKIEVEKKINILKLSEKKKEKEKEEQKNSDSNRFSRLRKIELNISKRNINPKNSFTLYDNNLFKSMTYSKYIKESNQTDIGYRLYKDYETRQKNLKKLKKKFTPSFTPIINKSSTFNWVSRNNTKMIQGNNISRYSEQKSKSLIYEYNSSSNSRQRKSRNPKKEHKNKYNNNIVTQPFNIKEINNNLKSTAVDSGNSKSRISVDNFATKLEKIQEFKDPEEEFSSSNYSLNNNSNKNTSSKIYKSEKSNKSLEQSLKLVPKRESKNLNVSNNVSEDKTPSKDNTSNKEESKSNIGHKDSSKNSIKECKSGKMYLNLKLEDIKPLLDEEPKNKKNESQTPTIGKHSSKKNNNDNIDLKLKPSLKKKSTLRNEIQESKEINKPKEIKENNNVIIVQNKDKTDNVQKENKNIDNKNKINTMSSNKSVKVPSIEKKISANLNERANSPKKINTFKKLFSKEKMEISPKKFMRNTLKINPKLILLQNKSNSFLSNNNKEVENPIQEETVFKNQNDSSEINNNIFNFENKDSNYLNDFFVSNQNSSKGTYKEEKIMQNSSFNFENQIEDSQNSANIDNNQIYKKPEKEILKQYNLDDTEKDESDSEEEENEENTENKSGSNNNEEKEQNISWIQKLNEISRNEGNKAENNFLNKRKNGGSTTRSQTKRKNDNNNNNFNSNKKYLDNFDDNKLYMLNLRSSSSTGDLNPYTVVENNPLFYKFFLKKSKRKFYKK